MTTRGTLYDGLTAYPHAVTAIAAGDVLRLETDTGHFVEVPLAGLTRTDEGEQVRLGHRDLPGWRLRLDEPLDPALAERLPARARYGRWIDRFGLGKAAVVCGVVAAGIVAVGYAAPHWLAPYVPVAWERNLGDSIVGDFGDNRCRSPSGQQALDALAERISPGVTTGPDRIQFAALDVNILNAAALPGNHIIVFRKMIRDARSSDELAGVLAHEIAHVRRRHVTEALLRDFGVSALIRLFAGGLGANAQQIVNLSYTRANEAQADGDAIQTLRASGIDPRPTAALFTRLANKDESESWQWLQSHPASSGRAKLFAASYDPRRTYRPALTGAQAMALYNGCLKTVPRRLGTPPGRPVQIDIKRTGKPLPPGSITIDYPTPAPRPLPPPPPPRPVPAPR